MMPTQGTGKRIVSKGEYAILAGKREALRWGSVGMAIATAVCWLLATGLVYAALIENSAINLLYLMLAVAGYAAARKTKCIAENAMQKALTKLDVVPLTRANAADLSTRECLAHTSAEPMQAQQTVLLRGHTDSAQTLPEQLAQAENTQEQHAITPIQQTGKRIVSKGEYAQAQMRRAILRLGALCLYVAVISCMFVAGEAVIGFLMYLSAQGKDRDTLIPPLYEALIFLVFGTLGYFLRKWEHALNKRAARLDVGIPLTPANTGHLPAAESLVRASAEPLQMQQAVLLRAATQGQETPSEQLVRAMDTQE